MDVGHNCGLVVAHSLEQTHQALSALQHRGKDAAGFAAIAPDRIDVIKFKGQVSRFDMRGLHDILHSLNHNNSYHTFFGHVRYATKGRKDQILKDAHPHTIGGTTYDRGDHVIIANCEMAAVHNGEVNDEIDSIDESLLHTTCDTERLLHWYKQHGAKALLNEIPGAYTLAIADRTQGTVSVLRDATGIKPGIIGEKEFRTVIASEDIALRNIDAHVVGELPPGSLYTIHPDGKRTLEEKVEPSISHCFFEYNYVASPHSTLQGVSVREVRRALGRALALQINEQFDYVTFVPRCPDIAAEAYAEATGTPLIVTFYKPRSTRIFQGPDQEQRENDAREEMRVLPEVEKNIAGKKVLVIDDSVVRGTNIKHVRRSLEQVGVREMVLASYTPPVGIYGSDDVARGCMFGVDMPPHPGNFVARNPAGGNRTVEEIGAEIGMRVIYLSPESMLETFTSMGLPDTKLCTYCIGGPHPFSNLVQLRRAASVAQPQAARSVLL